MPPRRLHGHSAEVLGGSMILSQRFTQSPRCRQAQREILKNTHDLLAERYFREVYSLWGMNASLISAHFRSLFSSYGGTQIPQVSISGLVNETEMANQWHFTIQYLLPSRNINSEETDLNFSRLWKTSPSSPSCRTVQRYLFFFLCGCFKPRQTGSKLLQRALPFKKNPAGLPMNCLKLSLFSSVIAQYSFFQLLLQYTQQNHNVKASLR